MKHFLTRQKYFFAILTVMVLAISVGYISLDSYVIRTAKEFVTSWLANEEISIQQGNLLSSVTKAQRILLTSDLVKAVRLDSEKSGDTALIEIGEPFSRPMHLQFFDADHISVERHGFGKYTLSVKINGSAPQVLSFLIQPRALILIYSTFFLTTVALLIAFAILLMRQARYDEKLRERLLMSALNEFIDQDHPSDILRVSIPAVVIHWNDLKTKLKQLAEEQIGLRVQVTLVKIAEGVAHDIRAPLGTIHSILELPTQIGRIERADISKSVLRITRIAEEFLSSSRFVSNHVATPTNGSIVEQPIANATLLLETINLSEFVEREIDQKRKELRSRPEINLALINPPSLSSAHTQGSELELGRIFSNLINNSVESQTSNAPIYVTIFKDQQILAIEIKDSGCGIPADVLRQLGSRRITYGKPEGNGTGLLRATQYLRLIGGELSIESNELGTTIQMRFPKFLSSSGSAL